MAAEDGRSDEEGDTANMRRLLDVLRMEGTLHSNRVDTNPEEGDHNSIVEVGKDPGGVLVAVRCPNTQKGHQHKVGADGHHSSMIRGEFQVVDEGTRHPDGGDTDEENLQVGCQSFHVQLTLEDSHAVVDHVRDRVVDASHSTVLEDCPCSVHGDPSTVPVAGAQMPDWDFHHS